MSSPRGGVESRMVIADKKVSKAISRHFVALQWHPEYYAF